MQKCFYIWKSFGFTRGKVKQSRFFGKCFKLKVEFLTWMKNFSLNDILKKMNNMAVSGRCDFGYIWPPEINSAVKLNFD